MARVPADVDAPDTVLYGLTFRQLAVLAGAALLLYTGWQALHDRLPTQVLVAGVVVAGALAVAVALGRRDGLPLDAWLLAAIRHTTSPRALSTLGTTGPLPDWVDRPAGRVPVPAPLRLPADAVTDDGHICLAGAGGAAVMVAASTTNLALRTPGEQAALVETFGRWLNSLPEPTQIVVSAQPVDLPTTARQLADTAERLPHPALAAACTDHAAFLADLAERRDPLRRQVLVTTGTPAGGRGAHQQAQDMAGGLAGLGVSTRLLDGAAVTAVLAAAADPYRPPPSAGLGAGDAVITAPLLPPETTDR